MKARTSEFFREIGRRGGLSTLRKHGNEFFERIGEKGGETMMTRYGTDHYRGLGKKGAAEARKILQAKASIKER